MSELSLRVTSAVLKHAGKPIQRGQLQIALTEPSADIASDLKTVTRDNRRALSIGGSMHFVLADHGALWRSHNREQEGDFDALFKFLARRPDTTFRVECQLTLL